MKFELLYSLIRTLSSLLIRYSTRNHLSFFNSGGLDMMIDIIDVRKFIYEESLNEMEKMSKFEFDRLLFNIRSECLDAICFCA